MERLGFRGPFFGGFKQKYGRECGRSNGGSAVQGPSKDFLGVFFSVKTPKKHFQKCQICPKQVGMEKICRLLVFFLKNRCFAQHGQNVKKAVFSLFFSIFLYSGVASGSFFGPQAPCDPL